MKKKFFVIFFAACFILTSNAFCVRAEEKENPCDFISRIFAEGVKKRNEEKTAQGKVRVVREIFAVIMNFKNMALKIVPAAKNVPLDLQNKFVEEFKTLVLVNNRAINKMADSPVGYKCQSVEGNYLTDKIIKVNGKFCLSDQKKDEYEGQLTLEKGNPWSVTNVSWGGADIVGAYQSELNSCCSGCEPVTLVKADIEYITCVLTGRNENDCQMTFCGNISHSSRFDH